MAVPKWVEDYLTENEIEHAYHHHRPVFTAEALASVEKVSTSNVAKVVVAMKDEKPTLFVLPANYRLDLATTKKALAARRMRLATEDEMRQFFPDCEVGAMPPIPHWQNVDIWLESEGFNCDTLVFQAGTHEDTAIVDFASWRKKVNPESIHISHDRSDDTYLFWNRTIRMLAIIGALTSFFVCGWLSNYIIRYTVVESFSGNIMVATVALFVAAAILGGFAFMGLACFFALLVPMLYPLTAGLVPFFDDKMIEGKFSGTVKDQIN